MKEYLTPVTAPATLAVNPEEVKHHLRVTGTTEDDQVKSIIKAAIRQIDGAEGFLGRALITQRWKLILDRFPCGKIKFPLPPFQTLHSITYIDEDGATQTMAAEDYRVVSDVTPAFVEPVYGESWPSTRCVDAAVRLEFSAGYGATWDKVPEDIRSWLKIKCADLYMNREQTVVGTIISEVPHVRDMLDNYRIHPEDVRNARWET